MQGEVRSFDMAMIYGSEPEQREFLRKQCASCEVRAASKTVSSKGKKKLLSWNGARSLVQVLQSTMLDFLSHER